MTERELYAYILYTTWCHYSNPYLKPQPLMPGEWKTNKAKYAWWLSIANMVDTEADRQVKGEA
jgi:hypothetical protein